MSKATYSDLPVPNLLDLTAGFRIIVYTAFICIFRFVASTNAFKSAFKRAEISRGLACASPTPLFQLLTNAFI
jgi:hypothetical protein